MLIGLISDTHIAFPDKTLPPEVRAAFKGVDVILHAGDIWIPSVLDELETIAPVKAAWGDDDTEADLGGDSRMMQGYTLALDGVTLWLMHEKPRWGLINLNREFSPSSEVPEGTPDIIVFGHTHTAAIERYKGVTLVNPGSPTLPNYILKLGTVGLLTVNSGEVDIRIIPLDND